MPRTRKAERSIDVEVSGDEEVEAKLRAIAERGRSTKPAFVQMLGDLEEAEAKWFRTNAEYRWPRLKDDTRRRHGEHKLLELTGTLLKSLVDRHSHWAVRDAHDGELRFGTYDPAAHLVAKERPVLAPLALERRRLVDRLREHILSQEI